MAADAKTYVIEKRGDKYCVLPEDRSRVLGCHPTQAAAAAQLAAIEHSKAARNHADLHAIKDVEIFRTGTWNGDPYTEDDLDAIVTAAGQVGYGVPIKAGHRDDSGDRALGWVENLRRNGSTLLADLTNLPEKVFEAIKDRSYDTVSAEIFWDLERNGEKYPRALKALALLGAEIPAVNLKPLHEILKLNAVLMPPALQAESYSTELKFEAVPASQGREPAMMTNGKAEPDEDDPKGSGKKPRADGSCPPGMTKGKDGLCYPKDTEKDMRASGYITRELMQELCPSCAETMAEKKIARLKIPRQADGTFNFEVLKSYAGFSQGLCDRWGDSEGFRTRCMAGMEGDVDDPGAFCNALKDWCGLSLSNAEKGGSVRTVDAPKPKPTTENPMTTTHEVRDGEIVVTMAEVQELRRKAEKADRLEPLEQSLLEEKAKNDEIEARRREDRITYKMRDVKLPVFRPYIRALYELATAAPQVKEYAVGNRKGKAEELVEMLVEEINKQAAHLFMTLSTTDPKKQDPDEPEDLQAKVDYRVRQYCRVNKLDYKKDYKTAVTAVLASDPDLKVEYSRS